MFTALLAGVGLYGATWGGQQLSKLGMLFLGVDLWKAKKKIDDYERTTRLGFDIIRDIGDESFGSRSFHLIKFPIGGHSRLKFLEGIELLLTSEETFVLGKAIEAVENEDPVVPFDFQKLLDVSKARFADHRFQEMFKEKVEP